MSLIDRLRPRWQNADPEVRLSAVRELGKEDQELLASVARQDEDDRVRRIALKKLEDPHVLLELAEKDPSEGLRMLAAERAGMALVGLATSRRDAPVCEDALSRLTDPKHLATAAASAFHPSVRRGAMSRLSNEKALGEVATRASDESIREEALRRISDASVLRRIALSDAPSELLLAALDKIDDPDTLLGIADDRTAQKAVRQRAQARLDRVVSDDHPIREKQRRERQLELCLAVETLASEAELEDAATRIRDAEREWRALAEKTEPREHVERRFREACEAVLDEVGRLERRRAESQRLESALQEGVSARIALCERVESLAGDEVPRALEEARRTWNRLPPLPEGEGVELAERFFRAVQSCENRHESLQAGRAFRSKMEGLVREAEQLLETRRPEDALQSRAALEKRWARLGSAPEPCDWKEEEARLRERFARAGQQLIERQERDRERQEQQAQENLARLEELCSRLEGMARSEKFNLREADRELRRMPVVWKIGPLPVSESRSAWKARLTDARQQLMRRLQDQKETEEWRRWANADVQQQLIRRAEALRDVEDLGEVAKELRRIQEEWKRFGTAPRGQSQVLWEQFHTIRDELRSRCDAYFAENLKKKEALCEKVEALADSTQWNETAEAIKQIQADWKQIGPVHHKKSEALWSRFRKPCDRFFEARSEHFSRLKQEREENEKKKVALCEKVEAIADSTDWEEVTEQIKRIQVEWKEIGPVSRKSSEALWSRFRGACDHFFERRKRRGELELEEKLRMAEAICADLEALASSFESEDAPSGEAARRKIGESWTDWTRIGWIPPEQAEPFTQRIRKACERIVAAHPESLHGTDLDPRTTRKKREKLCSRLERLVESYSETTTAPSAGDLAEQLKQAMAASALGGSSSREKKKDWRAGMQELERVTAKWERLGPILEEADQALADRFQKAHARFLDIRRRTAPKRRGGEAPPSK